MPNQKGEPILQGPLRIEVDYDEWYELKDSTLKLAAVLSLVFDDQLDEKLGPVASKNIRAIIDKVSADE